MNQYQKEFAEIDAEYTKNDLIREYMKSAIEFRCFFLSSFIGTLIILYIALKPVDILEFLALLVLAVIALVLTVAIHFFVSPEIVTWVIDRKKRTQK